MKEKRRKSIKLREEISGFYSVELLLIDKGLSIRTLLACLNVAA
jgi:hypothetical protein